MVVKEIWIYPIKSMDGISVSTATFLGSGALENDRKWSIKNQKNRFINAKRTSRIQELRCSFDSLFTSVSLPYKSKTYELNANVEALELALSDFLNELVRIEENRDHGFPDDDQRLGPTLVSEKTLDAVGKHFGLSYQEVIRRFRPNIIIEGPEVFEEDLWVGKTLHGPKYQLDLAKHCNRCIVPTRDSLTGAPSLDFKKDFDELRNLKTPQSILETFDHPYKLAINTHVRGFAGKEIKIGDAIRLPVNEG